MGASGWVEGAWELLVKGRRPAWGSASAGLRAAGPAGCPGPSSQASVGRALGRASWPLPEQWRAGALSAGVLTACCKRRVP